MNAARDTATDEASGSTTGSATEPTEPIDTPVFESPGPCERPELATRAEAATSGPGEDVSERVTLAVTGMTCDSCVRHVQEALEELEGVQAVVGLDPARAVVMRGRLIPVEALIAAVEEAGYGATLATAYLTPRV